MRGLDVPSHGGERGVGTHLESVLKLGLAGAGIDGKILGSGKTGMHHAFGPTDGIVSHNGGRLAIF